MNNLYKSTLRVGKEAPMLLPKQTETKKKANEKLPKKKANEQHELLAQSQVPVKPDDPKGDAVDPLAEDKTQWYTEILTYLVKIRLCFIFFRHYPLPQK